MKLIRRPYDTEVSLNLLLGPWCAMRQWLILAGTIANNVILDVLNGNIFDSSNPSTFRGIHIDGLALDANDIVETYSGGQVVAPYDHLYTKNNDETGIVNAGHYNIKIAGNVVGRTLKAATNYSDYGFGQRLSRVGWVDPAVSLVDLQFEAIELKFSGNGLLIDGNTMDGGAVNLRINPAAASNGVAFRNVVISNNTIKNSENQGMLLNGDGLIRFLNNTHDLDPYHLNSRRNADGSWAATHVGAAAVYLASADVYCEFVGESFKNCGIPINAVSTGQWVAESCT